jgi:hypothetical protein
MKNVSESKLYIRASHFDEEKFGYYFAWWDDWVYLSICKSKLKYWKTCVKIVHLKWGSKPDISHVFYQHFALSLI